MYNGTVYSGAGGSKQSLMYSPPISAADVMHSDTLTTWAPKYGGQRAKDDKDSGMVYGDKRVDMMYQNDYLGATGVEGPGLRLWPEEKKEISGIASRIVAAEKGM